MGTFKVLDGTFPSLSLLAVAESSQVAAFAGLGIFLAGIKPVLSGLEFSNHDVAIL
jgi:hypothetical protein